jgi:hypothetical protein
MRATSGGTTGPAEALGDAAATLGVGLLVAATVAEGVVAGDAVAVEAPGVATAGGGVTTAADGVVDPQAAASDTTTNRAPSRDRDAPGTFPGSAGGGEAAARSAVRVRSCCTRCLPRTP